MTPSRDTPAPEPSVWSFLWLVIKVVFFILATFETLDIVIVAYQQF